MRQARVATIARLGALVAALIGLWVACAYVLNWTPLPRMLGDGLVHAARDEGLQITYADVRVNPVYGLVFRHVTAIDSHYDIRARSDAVRLDLSLAALLRSGSPLAVVVEQPHIQFDRWPPSGGSASQTSASHARTAHFDASAAAGRPSWLPHLAPAVSVVVHGGVVAGLPKGPLQLGALATWSAGDFRLIQLDAARGGATLHWRGRLGLHGTGRGALTLQHLDVAAGLPLPARWRMSGRASLSGIVQGTLSNPVYTGSLQLSDGRIWGLPLDTASAQIELSRQRLTLKHVTATKKQPGGETAHYLGAGDVDLSADGGLRLSVQFSQADLQSLAHAAGWSSGPLYGPASGQLTFAGDYGKIQVDGRVQSKSARLGHVSLVGLSGRFDWRPDAQGGQLQLDDVQVAQADGSGGLFAFQGHVGTAGQAPRISGRVRASDLKLGRLHIDALTGPLLLSPDAVSFDADIDAGPAGDVLGLQGAGASLLGGALGGHLHVSGTPSSPQADLKLQWRDGAGLGTGLRFGVHFDEHGVRITPA